VADRPAQDQESSPADGTLLCEGCGAEVHLRHDPVEHLIETIEVFVAAHSRCGGRFVGYRIDLRTDRDREPGRNDKTTPPPASEG
jgi:hypothetical protein